jgi:hypothetical protein
MAEITRRQMMGGAAALPMSLLLLPGKEHFVRRKDWEAVDRCTFVAEMLVGRGVVPRKGDTVRIETPVMDIEGTVLRVRTKMDLESIFHAVVKGECRVSVKEHSGYFAGYSVTPFLNGSSEEVSIQSFHVTEA